MKTKICRKKDCRNYRRQCEFLRRKVNSMFEKKIVLLPSQTWTIGEQNMHVVVINTGRSTVTVNLSSIDSEQ